MMRNKQILESLDPHTRYATWIDPREGFRMGVFLRRQGKMALVRTMDQKRTLFLNMRKNSVLACSVPGVALMQ